MTSTELVNQIAAVHQKILYYITIENLSPEEAKARLPQDELDLALSPVSGDYGEEDRERIVWAQQAAYDTLHRYGG